jgi:hypothetical protein
MQGMSGVTKLPGDGMTRLQSLGCDNSIRITILHSSPHAYKLSYMITQNNDFHNKIKELIEKN